MSLDGERELGLYGLRVALAHTTIAAEGAATICQKMDRVDQASPWRESLDHIWNTEHQQSEETPITTTIERQWESVRKTLVTLMEHPFFRSRSALFTEEIGDIARQGNTSDSLESCEAAIHQLINAATRELMELGMEMSHVAEIPVMPLHRRNKTPRSGISYWPMMPRDFRSVVAMLEKFDPMKPFDRDLVRLLSQGNVYGIIANEKDRDVGCAIFEEGREDTDDGRDDTIIRLHACVVALHERRRGIAANFVDRVKATLEAGDFSSIDVVLPMNDKDSKAFFKRQLFQQSEIHVDEETEVTARVMNYMK